MDRHLFSRDQVVELRNQLEQYFQLISTFYIAYQIKLFENNGTVVAEEAEEARIYEQELVNLKKYTLFHFSLYIETIVLELQKRTRF